MGTTELTRGSAPDREHDLLAAEILSRVSDAVIVIDNEHRITYFGPGAERLYGLGAGEVLGKQLESLWTYRWVRDGDERAAFAALAEKGEWRGENVHVLPGGAERTVESSVSVLRDENGRQTGLLAVIRDISDRRLAERRLEELNEKERQARVAAERVGQMQQRILGIAGHDLRVPLQLIATCTELLFRSSPQGEQTQRIGQIRRATEAMRRILADLGDYTRVHQGDLLAIERRALDLEDLCRAVVADFRTSHPARDIALVASGPCEGEWDPGRLFQLLSNLLSNALVHGGPDARVEVRLRGGPVVELEVWNDGPAISPRALPTLFEPFRRTEESRRNHAAGLGLGLFIADEIARAHGGTIEVESGEDRGTCFRVRLPVRHWGKDPVP